MRIGKSCINGYEASPEVFYSVFRVTIAFFRSKTQKMVVLSGKKQPTERFFGRY